MEMAQPRTGLCQMRLAWDALSFTPWRLAYSSCSTWPCARTGTERSVAEPNRQYSRLMSMHAAGWNLGRGGRSIWRGALLALVALVMPRHLGVDAQRQRCRKPGGGAARARARCPRICKTGGLAHVAFRRRTRGDLSGVAGRQQSAQAGTGADPAMSPDGRWVVYRRDTKAQPGGLLIISTGTGTPRQLPASSDVPVVWSPDSRLVAATGSSTGHLAIVNVRSGKAIALRVPQASYGYSFSPDGTELAFTHSTGSGQNVYVVSTSSGAIRQLTDDGRGSSAVGADRDRLRAPGRRLADGRGRRRHPPAGHTPAPASIRPPGLWTAPACSRRIRQTTTASSTR